MYHKFNVYLGERKSPPGVCEELACPIDYYRVTTVWLKFETGRASFFFFFFFFFRSSGRMDSSLQLIRPVSIETRADEYFSVCRTLSSLPFEIGSRLSQFEKLIFHQTGLVELILPD
jgi:hypothetical protein